MATKTKADLIDEVVNRTGFTRRDTGMVINTLIQTLCDFLVADQRIEIRGLGVFKNKARKARVARNPRTGEEVTVPARSVPTFQPSKLLKARISGR